MLRSVSEDKNLKLCMSQINQLNSHSAQSIESVGALYVMKSRALKDAVVSNIYKSKDVVSGPAGQQRDDLFTEVKTFLFFFIHVFVVDIKLKT